MAYVINALLAGKIEKEKGFPAMIDWLRCGKYQRDNDNYFAALDRIIGINRSNFNVTVEQLVEAERRPDASPPEYLILVCYGPLNS